MNNSKLAMVRVECMGMSVEQGARDIVTFNPGEVIPVIEDLSKSDTGDIVTLTDDGVRRFVSKQWLDILEGYEPGNGFIRLEEASDIIGVMAKLFLSNKSVGNLPNNSKDVFETAAGVVEDHFVNNVFGDDEDEPLDPMWAVVLNWAVETDTGYSPVMVGIRAKSAEDALNIAFDMAESGQLYKKIYNCSDEDEPVEMDIHRDSSFATLAANMTCVND